MKLYRFSPIKNQKQLVKAITHIHFSCHRLCKRTFGEYLQNAGNVGVFCHYADEYAALIALRKRLCEPSNNPDQKYFKLHKPVVIPAKGNVPKTTYTYLYIRKPDPYRSQVGDIDFYLAPADYAQRKRSLETGKTLPGARIFPRQDLDMIELFDPDIDVLAYVSTHLMTEHVRVKQSNETKL